MKNKTEADDVKVASERKILKRILLVAAKCLGVLFLIAFMLIVVTSVTPIYDFQSPKPFSGRDIFNPYSRLDTAHCWKRTCFHVHTRVRGIFNECEYWPDEVYRRFEKFDYDIVTFSNHNEITTHPFDTALQVNVYEHGYNIFKYHKLVFGSPSVNYFDHLLPFLASQKQFQIDLLGKESDIIQMNHPLRTNGFLTSQFDKLEGYRLMELDSGRSTENAYWDSALSAGHYCFGLAGDDLHKPDKTSRIAVRCNFLCTPSATYKDILQTLREGTFYAMRVPDYGRGDWDVKYEMNKKLPSIRNIGLQDSTVFIALSVPADSIKFTGEHHTTLAMAIDSDSASYQMRQCDPYVRITAYFPQGEVIYSNPFARYDASMSESPFAEPTHSVNWTFTILFNLILFLLLIGSLRVLYIIFQRKC